MTCIVTAPQFLRHLTGTGHPERPARVRVIEEALSSASLLSPQNSLQPRSATEEELLLCHSKEYIALVKEECGKLFNSLAWLSTGDVVLSPESYPVACLAAGAALIAIDKIMEGHFRSAFCVVRPPGHHATSNQGMGFCIFNNVAVAARYIQKKYGMKRVLIVDFDVHHGNGTQDIFYEDPSVFYFSTHEAGNYPGTGSREEKGVGNCLNCPITGGKDSRIQVLRAFQEELMPAMERFQPEAVFISAGFDAHHADPLGGLDLIEADFFELTAIVQAIAQKFAKGRLISVLEGGYNLEAIATSAVAHVQALRCC